MKTLVVDNYDSFTHNLVHLLADINDDMPIVIRNNEISLSELNKICFDNVVISPGPGHPGKDGDFGVSAQLIADCRKPLLGVCLGHQGIATAFGGKVAQAPVPVHGSASLIRHCGRDILRTIGSPFFGARYHSLVVQRPLPNCLLEIAWSEEGLIMGIAHRQRPLWGVQFHPESIITEYGHQLLCNFRDLSRESRSKSFHAAPTSPIETLRRHRGGKVAVWKELPEAVDTEAAFARLFANSESAFWLDSSLVETGQSRWSYLGDASGPDASSYTYDAESRMTTIVGAGAGREQVSILDLLARDTEQEIDNLPPCPFTGGHVGWLGFEMGRECGGHTPGRSETPDAYFIHADRFVAVDHEGERTYVVAIARVDVWESAEQWVEELTGRLSNLEPLSVDQPSRTSRPITFRLHRGRDAYQMDIEQCLQWIREGETYQVCLTNEIRASIEIDPLTLYRTLRRVNPAPYAAFLRWHGGAVLSASPERFLHVDATGRVETKPIKGTTARSADPADDRRLAEWLIASAKDRAENIMIVDLLRNDLSRVCDPGSVRVSKLCDLETYATVHQLVSTVVGQLAPGRTTIDLVRATFPGGSMTGAPKVRTLQLIDRLEQRPRGVYSGVLGWLGNDGGCDLSIVIRTLVQIGDQLSIGVGGGIVAGSSVSGEYEEMLLKAKASIRAVVIAAAGDFREDLCLIEDAMSADERVGQADVTRASSGGARKMTVRSQAHEPGIEEQRQMYDSNLGQI